MDISKITYYCPICLRSGEEIFEESDAVKNIAFKQITLLNKKKNEFLQKKHRNIFYPQQQLSSKKQKRFLFKQLLIEIAALERKLLVCAKRTITVIGHLHPTGAHTACSECFQSYIKRSLNCIECRRRFTENKSDATKVVSEKFIFCIDSGKFLERELYTREVKDRETQGIFSTISLIIENLPLFLIVVAAIHVLSIQILTSLPPSPLVDQMCNQMRENIKAGIIPGFVTLGIAAILKAR